MTNGREEEEEEKKKDLPMGIEDSSTSIASDWIIF